MTELECFKLLDETIEKRNDALFDKFGKNFLQALQIDPSNRKWYQDNIAKYDEVIVDCGNKLAKILKLNITFKKVADVFSNEDITNWYNTKKIAQTPTATK